MKRSRTFPPDVSEELLEFAAAFTTPRTRQTGQAALAAELDYTDENHFGKVLNGHRAMGEERFARLMFLVWSTDRFTWGRLSLLMPAGMFNAAERHVQRFMRDETVTGTFGQGRNADRTPTHSADARASDRPMPWLQKLPGATYVREIPKEESAAS